MKTTFSRLFTLLAALLLLVALALTLGYAALGFLDDLIKIRFRRNLGLKAYQKIVGQLGLAAIAAYFCFAHPAVGTKISLPFGAGEGDLGWGIIPFVMLVYVATTNSVNLTDGLDGLAATTSAGYFLTFAVLTFLAFSDAEPLLHFDDAAAVFFARERVEEVRYRGNDEPDRVYQYVRHVNVVGNSGVEHNVPVAGEPLRFQYERRNVAERQRQRSEKILEQRYETVRSFTGLPLVIIELVGDKRFAHAVVYG